MLLLATPGQEGGGRAANVRRMDRRRLALELAVNLVVPWLAYEALTRRGWTELQALMAVTVVPLAWGFGVLLHERKWDPVALFSAGGMGLSLIAVAMSEDVRALQVRESYLTLLIGLALLVSAALRRPLLLALVAAQGKLPAERLQSQPLRRIFSTLTWVWGGVLVAEFAVKLWMIQALSISMVLAVGPWVQNGLLVLAGLWSFWWVRRTARLPAPQPARARR